MPARKSQLQGLKTCNRLGVKKKKEARQVHAVSGDRRNPQAGSGQNWRGGEEKHRIAHPKATEIMILEALKPGEVKKKKWIWLNFFFFLPLLKI